MVAIRPAPLVLVAILLARVASADILSGEVHRQVGGQAVPGVDIDVFDQVTGVKLVTPNDNTDAQGEFSVVVPPGLYRVAFDPTGPLVPGSKLAPA
ncbi:MAG TPA: hypothetical protein VKF62_10145 [Planctomycetota bacterium]|nr:hypothetical protein [Planctomycetota bacterium]